MASGCISIERETNYDIQQAGDSASLWGVDAFLVRACVRGDRQCAQDGGCGETAPAYVLRFPGGTLVCRDHPHRPPYDSDCDDVRVVRRFMAERHLR